MSSMQFRGMDKFWDKRNCTRKIDENHKIFLIILSFHTYFSVLKYLETRQLYSTDAH